MDEFCKSLAMEVTTVILWLLNVEVINFGPIPMMNYERHQLNVWTIKRHQQQILSGNHLHTLLTFQKSHDNDITILNVF